MAKNIPTKEVIIGNGDNKKTVQVYQWLTQTEETEYTIMLTGDPEMTPEEMEKSNFKTKMSNVLFAQRYLVSHLVVDLNMDDFDCWSPEQRKDLLDAITGIANSKKK